jgi:hypothetical protein
MPRSNQRHPHYNGSHRRHSHHKDSSSYEEEHADTHAHTETDVLEVWFAGCHCGTPPLEITCLVLISLCRYRWRVRSE